VISRRLCIKATALRNVSSSHKCGGGRRRQRRRPIHFSTRPRFVNDSGIGAGFGGLVSDHGSIMSHRNSKPHPNGAATALPFESLNVDSGASLSGTLQSTHTVEFQSFKLEAPYMLSAWLNVNQ
jgi:hypothetical protein